MYQLKSTYKQLLADTITPVSVYLKLRDRFPNSLLLESSDYHANTNSFSYICCNPIASIKVQNERITENFPDGTRKENSVDASVDIPEMIHKFTSKFQVDESEFKFINNGIFGYISYDAVRYFEDLEIVKKQGDLEIPDIYYAIYQNIIAINHYNNEAYVFNHSFDGSSKLEQIVQLLKGQNIATFPFSLEGEELTNETEEGFIDKVRLAKQHCHRGDVFQLVLSRRFSQHFKGDEFNVYRSLRHINPSPYLFYFDYGDFKIFGSSPEAHLIVKNDNLEIHPIAGTYKRTGNDEQDAVLARNLTDDVKENSEHVMLVDLARNDLSRHGSNVKVETYKEIQFFSHVIHLVSKVTGKKKAETSTMQVVADTFPAGTLSGAPKHRAMQLIENYETVNRDFYGGAIGFMDFEGNFNHAIIIRTFLSKDHKLHFQAGAGIVADSDEQNELQEVYNKLAALKKALKLATEI